MSQSIVEKELLIKIPNELKPVWSKAEWNSSNNVFTLYNYKPFYLLEPSNEVEIVSQSKSLNSFIKQSDIGLTKTLVFAKSFLADDGQFLFYGFDENNENKGIWVWHINQGPQFPSKIANNLTEIFESINLMVKGFSDSEVVSKTWIKASNGKLKKSDLSYGNFPRKDLKEIAEEICPTLIYFPNKTTFLVKEEKIEEIDEFYSKFGRIGLKDEMQNENLTETLQKVNMESFNIGKDNMIFIVKLYNSPTYGLCSCSKSQARELNRFGYLSFYNLIDSEQSSNFISE